MIFRLSANVIIEASWETPDGERHELAQWQAREPWWTQKLFAIELPRAAEGKVQLRAAPTKDGTDAGTLELSFAEVVRGPQGRCYHDRVAAVSPPVSLREAHVCLAPVEAELALSTEQAKTLRVNFSQTGSGGSLVVSATGPSQSTELLRLQGENPLIWNEAIAALPSSGSRPDRIRFSLRSADPTSFFAWNTEWVVPRQPSTPPNVLVYLVDTLRADALEPYDPSQSTPGFAALARAGIVFEDVLSPTSWTLPAVASLLSGRSIRGHGVETANDVLPAQITTLAEHFRRAGFRTAAASANEFVTDKSGLEQGFEVFAVFAGRVVNGRSSAGMNDFAVPWIEAHRDEPFFLYLHVVDPHQPYLTDPSI